MGALPSGTVSFLLGDVEGSTRLAARLGDSYALVLKKGLKLACDRASALGGHFLTSEADSFLFVFDSATIAVRAAIEAQRALGDAEWAEGSEVRIRMGVHSGEAVVANGDYAGLEVNRAARVAHAGHGGQILLSSLTRRLVEGRLPAGVALQEVGVYMLAGIEEPEELFQVCVEGLRRSFPPLRALPSHESGAGSIVGRVHQVSRIGAALDEAMAGNGRLVLITGDAGMGKTRICDEISSRVRAKGLPVLWGRCWEGSDAPPYWPWAQVIQPLVEQGPPPSKAQRSLLAKLDPSRAEEPPADAESDRFRVFDAVVQLLRIRSASTPLVLILDDVHAADDPSLQLLRFVVRELRSMAVLFLVTYRESEVSRDEVLTSAFGSIEREGEKIALPPLAEPDVATLIQRITGSAGQELAKIVLEASEGNPLFVREVIGLFGREGDLHRPDESTGFLVPAGARDVLKRRLATLSDRSLGVLTTASAIGRTFSLETLQLISDLGLDELLGALEEAQDRDIVRQTSALGRYSFGHVLLRETLYEGMSSSERMQLHRGIAEALEGDAREDPMAHVAEIAHHFFKAAQAGDMRKTLEYNRRAGEAAENTAAFHDAVRHYKRALLAADLARVGRDVEDELKEAIDRVRQKASAPLTRGSQ